jgi:hypothetical protein
VFTSIVSSWQRCVSGFVSVLNCVVNSSDTGKRKVKAIDDLPKFCIRSVKDHCNKVQLSYVLRNSKLGSD